MKPLIHPLLLFPSLHRILQHQLMIQILSMRLTIPYVPVAFLLLHFFELLTNFLNVFGFPVFLCHALELGEFCGLLSFFMMLDGQFFKLWELLERVEGNFIGGVCVAWELLTRYGLVAFQHLGDELSPFFKFLDLDLRHDINHIPFILVLDAKIVLALEVLMPH